jgi:hypothetical protein
VASALPGKFDIEAYRGDTKEWTATFADDATPPAPVDMSAWSWLAQIRATQDEPATVVATMTVDATSAATGTLVITLPATEAAKLVTGDAAGFDPGKATYYWDLQGTDGAVVKTWLAGKVKVTGDVSVTP